MEFLRGLFSGEAGAVAQVAVIIIAVQGSLSGLKLIIDSVKDHTENNYDNKAADILGKILEASSKLLDFFQGNVKH